MTTIDSRTTSKKVHINKALDAENVVIEIEDGRGHVHVIVVDRPGFLKAVSELDVLTIDGGQEPLAQWELELLGTTDAASLTADHAEALAVYYAILAAEKRKTPRVDERQVEALAGLLRASTGVREDSAAADGSVLVARDLLRSGKVTVQS